MEAAEVKEITWIFEVLVENLHKVYAIVAGT